jgi:ribosome-associated protein
MTTKELRKKIAAAIAACEAKKAENVTVLEMDRASPSFTDYFVIVTGSNPRQMQAISDEVEQRLSKLGLRPAHIEGYNQADWVLLDYVDFVVHIFSEKARHYYDLERLWKSAKRLPPAELSKPRKAAASRARSTPPRPRRRAKS